MKRVRDENPTGPQTKRPAMVRGETSGQAHGAAPQRLTTDDAFSYLKAVKDIFKDKKGKYDEFLEVMKDFKAQRINTSGVITRVKELFKGHRDLILGFNTFLPKGYEITLPVEEEPAKKQQVEFGQAISYVNKIKTRFQHDEHIYKAFLEILYMYRKGNKSINEVYEEVATLFREHQDLLEEFTYFLPDTSGVVHPTHKMSGISMPPRRDDKSMAWPVPKLSQPDKLVKREKMVSAQHDRDRSSEKQSDRQNYDRVVKVEKDQRKKEREQKYERDEKEKDYEENDSEDEQDSQRLSNKRKSARRADDMIRKQSQVGEGEGYVGLPGPLDEKKIPKNLQKKLGFFDKLKIRLGNNETYQEFLKCLNMYTEEIISREDLHNLVGDLLGGFKDLMEGFNDFLNYCEGNEGFLATTISKRLGDGVLIKPKVERDREKERDGEKDSERDRDKDGGDINRDIEKEREKDKLSSQAPREPPIHKTSLVSSKEKYLAKPISELDLSNCERCTPSYRLLPKSYPKPVASLRSEWAHSVLNDKWVSVTSGSEDYSFKHMRKNQYEESLFRCEDDRFELDMLLETTAVTTQRIEELMQKMQEVNGTQEVQIHVEDYLKAIHLRCIERIYGDHGLDVIDLLRKNVSVALPVILTRLKQKQEEWTKCRADMNKIWAEVYAKNYHKSLDHRSFYFKQQDKKSLSTKALLAEVKEISEKKRRDDDFILSVAAGNTRAYSPDLNFEYVDRGIYDDLYRIIKYSADEMCSSMEQSDKVMRLWTAFLEPFFGLPARIRGTEDTEDVVKVKLPEIKANGLDNVASNGSLTNGRAADKKHSSSKHHSSLTEDQMTSSSKNETGKSARFGSLVSGSGSKSVLDGKTEAVGQDSYSATVLGVSEHADGVERHGHLISEFKSSTLVPSCSTMSKANDSSSRRDYVLEKDVDKFNESRRAIDHSDSRVNTTVSKCVGVDIAFDSLNGRLEREEGELSPSPEVEERHTNNGSGGHVEQGQVFKNSIPDNVMGRRVEEDEEGEYDAEAEGEPDVDADDEGEESGQKTGEGDDSENGSEPGEDISGTESEDGDDSHEDHEDEEDEDEQLHEKNGSESEAEGMADAHEHGSTLRSWDRSLRSSMPLPVHGPSITVEQASAEESTVFYGNDSLYVLFRLHQTLYERILSAKINAKAAEHKWKSTKDMTSPDLYEKFMRVLYNLLDGSADNAKFEDDCRAIIGTQSYVLFTLDKLIYKLVKQLQAAASDEMANKFLALHSYEKCRPSGGFMDAVYHANANVVSHDENLYRFEHASNSGQLSIQLMEDRSSEKFELTANAMDQKFLKYLGSFLVAAAERQKENGVFLARNKLHYGEGDDCTVFAKAMKNVFVANGLEYKISCNSSKVSYVLDTRDFFFRKDRKRKASNHGRVQKFHQWLDSVS
eukprot:c22220_g5_i1 orf=585-4820(-)